MKFFLKFLGILFIGILSVSLVSCGDDNDEPENTEGNSFIVGTWSGYSDLQKPTKEAMTAKFYEDGTCEIWWYNNPLLASYYFRGYYTVTKKKLHLVGYWGDQYDTPSIEYDKTVNYSYKNGVLTFKFDLVDRHLTKD